MTDELKFNRMIGRPVHFVGGVSRYAACGTFRSFRILHTEQVGEITCRKCLSKMKARAALAAAAPPADGGSDGR